MLKFKKHTNRYQIQAPLTSLIDIVFLLLIYFLLTTNFIVEEGIKIKLPQTTLPPPRSNRRSPCLWTGRVSPTWRIKKSPWTSCIPG